MQIPVGQSRSRFPRKKKLGKQKPILSDYRNAIMRHAEEKLWSATMTTILCVLFFIYLYVFRISPLMNETQVSKEYFPKQYSSVPHQNQVDESELVSESAHPSPVPSVSNLRLSKNLKKEADIRKQESERIKANVIRTNGKGQDKRTLSSIKTNTNGERKEKCSLSPFCELMIRYPLAMNLGMFLTFVFLFNLFNVDRAYPKPPPRKKAKLSK